MLELLEKWGNHFSLVIAGFLGAAVAARVQPTFATRTQLITFLISGAVSAQYLTSLATVHFGVSATHANGIAFLIGAFSGSLIARILIAIQKADLIEIVKSWFGGGK